MEKWIPAPGGSMQTLATERSTKPWYAVQTRQGSERITSTLLACKGYEVYYPVRPPADSRQRKESPLFPSYLFCRSSGDILGLIVSTPGVVRLLGIPGKPEPVPEEEVEGVRRLLAVGRQVGAHYDTQPGTWVRIKKGPLSGVTGQVVGQAANRRLVVSVQLLQRSVSIALEPSWLEPSGPEPSINVPMDAHAAL
jgi:transcription antitermination factor NusG